MRLINNWILNKNQKYGKIELFNNRTILFFSLVALIDSIVFMILTKELKTPTSFTEAINMKLDNSASISASIGMISIAIIIISLAIKLFCYINRKRKEK